MDEPFVDFYQILGLPLDADRNTLRKRINELYLDAQGNLDHRNFATRLKYQQLFEATLPEARFVLLDDTRRAEYSVLVRAFRAPSDATLPPLPPVPRSAGTAEPQSDATLSREAQRRFDEARRFDQGRRDVPEELFFDARGAEIDPLPTARPSAEQLEAQRQELWKKWKSGLEEALGQQQGLHANNSMTRSALAAESQNAEAQNLDSQSSEAKQRETREREGQRQREFQRLRAEEEAAAAVGQNRESAADSEELVAARRWQHRRDVTREILVNVGLTWSCVGALLVVVPGVIALVALMGHNFPRGGRALSAANPNVLWTSGFIIIALAAFVAAQTFSRAMRRRVAMQLALLTYEDLLRRFGGPNR